MQQSINQTEFQDFKETIVRLRIADAIKYYLKTAHNIEPTEEALAQIAWDLTKFDNNQPFIVASNGSYFRITVPKKTVEYWQRIEE